MVTLFCAIVGVDGNAFPVDIDAGKAVGHLKDEIQRKKPQTIPGEADKLELFLAKKGATWLNNQDVAAVALDEHGTPQIVDEDGSVLAFCKMDPLLWIKNDKYFGADFQPNEGEIHLLVVVPVGERDHTTVAVPLIAEQMKMVVNEALEERDHTTAALKAERMKMVVNEALEERDRKRSVYSISTCPRSKEMLLKQHLGLEYSTIPVNEVVDDSIHGYQWSELIEKHPDQRKAYMEYVEEHLRDALTGQNQKDFLKDVAGMRGLLDCNDQCKLPFKVKGTADMMIIDETANRIGEVFAGLLFVIEVKKDRPSGKERWQLLLELVVADLMSEGRCAPVGLLTNLNDYWYFLWFTPDNKIARMLLTCPANGFKVMKEVLKERSGPTCDGHFMMHVAVSNSPLPLKRQKLPRGAIGRDDAAAEMLERYELMSDELSPEFLQQQRVEYAFNLIRQMPIHSAMYT